MSDFEKTPDSSVNPNTRDERVDEPTTEAPVVVHHVEVDQAPVSEQEVVVRHEVPEEEFNAALGGAASLLGDYDKAKEAGTLDEAEQVSTYKPPALAEYGAQLDAQEESKAKAEQATDSADNSPVEQDLTPEQAIEIAPANLKPINEAEIPDMVNVPSDRLWDDFHKANGTDESGNPEA